MDASRAPGTFEAALEQVQADEPPAAAGDCPLDPEAIGRALARVAIGLPMVDNLGLTADERDLYPLIDTVTAAVKTTYPEILCKAGCSSCCHYPVALYTISRSEWRPIAEHVERHWPRERLVAFVSRFWDTHGPYVRRLRVLNWLMEFPLPVVARREAIPLACPFLEDGRCSVYEARPAQARAFGFFSIKRLLAPRPMLYGCDMLRAHMDPILAGGERPRLPRFEPLFGVRSYFGSGRKRLIPLWVARQWPQAWLREATCNSYAFAVGSSPHARQVRTTNDEENTNDCQRSEQRVPPQPTGGT